MYLSPYAFLQANPNDPCGVLLADIPLNLETAFLQCSMYRQHLTTLPNDDPKKKVKSYVLPQHVLNDLLGQNNGRIDGIRIYIGHELVGDKFAVRLFVVACTKNVDGRFDDYNIPPAGSSTAQAGKLGEARPCPDECGSSNGLNNP